MLKNIFIILSLFFTLNHAKELNIDLTQEELDFIKDHPNIVLGSSSEFSPYVIVEKDGKIVGFDVDVLNEINHLTGMNFSLKIGNWKQVQDEAKSSVIDGLSTGIVTKERGKYLNFSDVYSSVPLMVITRIDNTSIKTLQDLDGKKIAIVKSNVKNQEVARAFKNSTILEYDNTIDVMNSVITGKADVMFGISSLLYTSNIQGTAYLKMAMPLGSKLDLVFAVNKKFPLAATIINKALKQIGQNKLLKLQYKWFLIYKDEVDIDLTQEEKAYLKENSITYAGDPQWLPFEAFDENGNYSGIVAEHIEIVEKKLNKKFDKIITNHWLDTLELSKKRGVDIISGDAADVVLSINYKAIDTYLKNPLVIVTRKEHPYVEDLNNIKDKKIAFGAGGGYSADILKKYPDIRFIECDTPQSGLLGVKTGKYDAFIGTLSTSDYMIVQMGIEDIKIAGQTDITMNLTLFVDREKPLLYSIINKSIKTISKEKQHEIISKWRSPKVKKVIDYTLVWQISMVFFVLTLIGLSFTLMLRKSNKKLKQAEQETRYLSERMILAFDGSRDGLWDWNLIENSIYYSSRWKEMLGYRDDELDNSFDTWQSRIHPDDLPKVLKDVELSIKDEDVLFENKHRLRHKDGHWVWIYDRGKVQRDLDGKAIRMIGTHTDLTTEINLNNELGELNETLEVRVQDQVEELERRHTFMAQQARLASMGEMLSSIAHQWRQPLNRINSNVSVLRSVLRRDPVDHEMLTEQTEMIEKNTKYMSDTIGDFANFFHPEKKEVEFSLQNVIKKALELINQRTENVQIHIVSDKALEVYSFEKEYLQVVLIILNNAIDNFGSKAIKEPKIDIIMKEHEGMVTLAICDNGGGIDEKDIDRIFDPYYSTKFAKEGTGLGLYVGKMLIENSMHGQLQVKNQQGSACFEIIIPQRKDKCLI